MKTGMSLIKDIACLSSMIADRRRDGRETVRLEMLRTKYRMELETLPDLSFT